MGGLRSKIFVVMKDCVCCKIVAGEIVVEKIWEDEKHLAFLGIFPRFPGMTVVATKKHLESYIYQSMDDTGLSDLHVFAKKVAKMIDQSLGSMRCIQVMEGLDVNHAHLKLFPVYEGKNYGIEFEGDKKASEEELKKVAEKIRSTIS